MRINQNIMAFNAYRNLSSTQGALGKSLEIKTRSRSWSELHCVSPAKYIGELAFPGIEKFIYAAAAAFAVRIRQAQPDIVPLVSPNIDLHQRTVQCVKIADKQFDRLCCFYSRDRRNDRH